MDSGIDSTESSNGSVHETCNMEVNNPHDVKEKLVQGLDLTCQTPERAPVAPKLNELKDKRSTSSSADQGCLMMFKKDGSYSVPSGCRVQLNFPLATEEFGLHEPLSSNFTLSYPDVLPISGYTMVPYQGRELQRKFKHYRSKLRQLVPPRIKEKKLRKAAELNNVELVQRLLSQDANPNGADEDQRTALHIAASKGYTQIVQLLLDHKANPNQKDSVGNTPLHVAAWLTHIETVTLLLKAGTNVEQLDDKGFSPIQLAKCRLRQLQTSSYPCETRRQHVNQIVEMMQAYLARAGNTHEAELMLAFSNKLSLSDKVETNLHDLLKSLKQLDLSPQPH